MNKVLTRSLIWVICIVVIAGCKKKEEEPMGEGDVSMILPYKNLTDIKSINEAYSTNSNAPWGFAHNGIDFTTKENLAPFQAVASGKVTELRLWKNDKSPNWQVNIGIKYNAQYTVVYSFEPFSQSQEDGQTQLNNIFITPGQMVVPGQLIGKLFNVGNGAHVHFGLNKDGTSVCPEEYFTIEAKNSLIDLIHSFNPSWEICY